jgi:SAM-dependent methyltransferase
MNDMLFEYRGALYPDFIRRGNAMQFVAPLALQFCRGRGVDIGCGDWPLPDAVPVELRKGGDAYKLPAGPWDYAFSSHCLEHLTDPIRALEHWRDSLRPGGALFLYLPHPDMAYWQPQFNRRHLHTWAPAQMAEILRDLDFADVIHSERDLAWGFSVVGFKR